MAVCRTQKWAAALTAAAFLLGSAAGDEIVFRPANLTEAWTSDYGATLAPPPDLPSETLPPPPPPAMPIQGSYVPGVEWYAAIGPVATGPIAGDAVLAACKGGATSYWRAGMSDWRACASLDWDAGHIPPPIKRDFVTALGPPSLAADANAVWFWRAEIGGAWIGPLGPQAIRERTAVLRFEDNPDIWRAEFGGWLQAHSRRKPSDDLGLPIGLTNDLTAPQEKPTASGTISEPSKAGALAVRLAGAWYAKGVVSDGYSTPVVQVVIDPRGLMSVNESVVTNDGDIVSSDNWVFGTFVLQVLGDDTALISASFNYHRLKYGFPAAFKFSLLPDGTLRDEWSGVVLTRYAAFPG